MKKEKKSSRKIKMYSGILMAGTVVKNLFDAYMSKRQVDYFKKMGCEVYEIGPDGTEKKL